MTQSRIKYSFDSDVTQDSQARIRLNVESQQKHILDLCVASLSEYFEDWNDLPATKSELEKFRNIIFIESVSTTADTEGNVITMYINLGDYFSDHMAEGIAINDDLSDLEFTLVG